MQYLFLADDGFGDHHELSFDHFNARKERNDYEVGSYAEREKVTLSVL